MILVDPAYHFNVGDNLIALAEIMVLEERFRKWRICGGIQGGHTKCFNPLPLGSLALYHGGGTSSLPVCIQLMIIIVLTV